MVDTSKIFYIKLPKNLLYFCKNSMKVTFIVKKLLAIFFLHVFVNILYFLFYHKNPLIICI